MEGGLTDIEQWVPCGVAYMLLGDELARRLAYDPIAARNEATLELKDLLGLGRVTARALEGEVDFEREVGVRRHAFIADHEARGIAFNREFVASKGFEQDYDLPEKPNWIAPSLGRVDKRGIPKLSEF